MTGRKADQKIYRHHTQFPGGLKEIPFKVMLERNPEEVRSGSHTLSRSAMRRLPGEHVRWQ